MLLNAATLVMAGRPSMLPISVAARQFAAVVAVGAPPFTLSQHRTFSISSASRFSKASIVNSNLPSSKDNQPETTDLGEKHPQGSYLLFRPVYSQSDLDSVQVVARQPKTFGDRVAKSMVWVARSIFDLATRYPGHQSNKFPLIQESADKKVDLPSHLATQKTRADQMANDGKNVQIRNTTQADVSEINQAMTLQEMRKKGLVFGPDQWLNRMIFLETIAGVPGMVAATCRHLQSLRLMKRDKGWIHTMLEDAENERMHLLTFMTIAKPGIIARTFALLAQGVFYNFFFVFYILIPRVAHRFVGVLEEEAVLTYTMVLEDIKAGRLPEWENLAAPEIAKEYWQLKSDADFQDVIRAVRADEATHRHINHTFASLESTDPNPFAYREAPAKMRGESYGLERDEALQWAKGRQGKDKENNDTLASTNQTA